MHPKVSIIVPVHDAAWSLPECLDSLAGQSLRDTEIVIVNDASSDESGDIIDAYARKDSRIRFITNTVNLNLFESRRIGFEAANGEFIATCDSDDVMPPRALECLYAAAIREKADMIHGRACELHGKRSGSILYNCEPFQVSTGRMFVDSMLRNIRGWNVWGKLFNGKMMRSRIGAFPRNTGWFQAEDIAYCSILGLASRRYVGISDVVYTYRYSDFRSTRYEALKEKKIRDQIQILAFLRKMIGNDPYFRDLDNSFHVMANHVLASMLGVVSAESRKCFLEDIGQIGLESVRRPNLLSWRYHYDWIRRNGMNEYMIRMKTLSFRRSPARFPPG